MTKPPKQPIETLAVEHDKEITMAIANNGRIRAGDNVYQVNPETFDRHIPVVLQSEFIDRMTVQVDEAGIVGLLKGVSIVDGQIVGTIKLMQTPYSKVLTDMMDQSVGMQCSPVFSIRHDPLTVNLVGGLIQPDGSPEPISEKAVIDQKEDTQHDE